MAGLQRRRRLDRRWSASAALRRRGEEPTHALELTAAPEDEGLRLDSFLARHTDMLSRAAAQRLIEEGAVSVDGRRRPKSHRLARGEVVTLRQERPAPTAPADGEPRLVYEDDHLLVVEKPAGLLTHPAPGRRGPTLAEALAGRGAGGDEPERAGIVHRLDRDTSGLLAVARSPAVHAALRQMLRRREIARVYLALVQGQPDANSGTIDAALGRDRLRRTVVSTRTDRARAAVTHFRVLERLARTALLELRLETGRTHQIRAHLAAIGHPICGDARYGGRACGQRLGLERQFLHAAILMFRHPVTGEEIRCESKPPVDLCCALDAARREPVSGGPDGD